MIKKKNLENTDPSQFLQNFPCLNNKKRMKVTKMSGQKYLTTFEHLFKFH